MRACVLVEPGRIETRDDVDMPVAGPDDVVVQVKSALTCGTDLKAYRRGHHLMPPPTLFGHEFSGVIVDKGNRVERFSVGQPVMSVHTAPCGECVYCGRSLQNLCPHLTRTMALGAYAEYLRVPAAVVDANMYPKPDDLGYREAAMLEPLSCVAYGISQAPVASVDSASVASADSAVVIGAGAIGLLHVMVLKEMGVKQVIVSGRHDYRLQMAEKVGADLVIDSDRVNATEAVLEATGGHGSPIVFECTGLPSVWEEAVTMVGRGGCVVLFGGCPGGTTVTYDTARLHYDQITLKGVFHFTPEAVRDAYHLLADGRLDVTPLITGDRTLEEVPETFRNFLGNNTMKYAIIP